MKRILLPLLLWCLPLQAAEPLEAVELYTQDQLLTMLRSNSHLAQVRRDDCQLVEDIEARAKVLKVPAYQMLWADMLLYGVCVERDVDLGFDFLYQSARQGLPDALEQLGRYHIEGRFVVVDEPHGLRLLYQAASLGHERALLSLAAHYAQGKGSPRDYPQVYLWLHETVYDRAEQRQQAQEYKDQLAQRLPPSVREHTRRTALGR
ncbi:tetratricopeptide repeat protein [Ferrimonas marina]|nr:SEL1-like repeat protein [Ferrimonas marina]